MNSEMNQSSGVYGFVDIHCHCLPFLDDGPGTYKESIELCRELKKDGIANVIATCHQLGRYGDTNTAEKIREAVSVLNEMLEEGGIDLTLTAGGDVRVDERICDLLKSDSILTLNDGGKYILLELPHDVFINIESLLSDLSDIGIEGVISHPERHSILAKNPEKVYEWMKYSAHLQITSGSLLGYFGSEVEKSAWAFLESGNVSFIASDSHDTKSRKPCMRGAYEAIKVRFGEEAANVLCIENPLSILKGESVSGRSIIKSAAYK
jgi:protein-tyrosine phosphatase